MERGKFIVFEGISGAGKSTAAKQLVTLLEKRGMKAIYNHGAFTYTEVGRLCKETARTFPPIFSTSYYLADLVQDTLRNIKPWLEQGYFVIQDRYVDSITSYIRAVHHQDETQLNIKPVIDLYTELHLVEKPDLTVWCRSSRDVILTRLSNSDLSERQHQEYSHQPQMIDRVQDEFNRLITERSMENEQTITLQTDTPTDLDLILRVLNVECTRS